MMSAKQAVMLGNPRPNIAAWCAAVPRLPPPSPAIGGLRGKLLDSCDYHAIVTTAARAAERPTALGRKRWSEGGG